MFQRIGLPEVIVVVAALLLLFGAKRIPEIARALGKSMSEFKKGQQEGSAPDDRAEADKSDKPPAA